MCKAGVFGELPVNVNNPALFMELCCPAESNLIWSNTQILLILIRFEIKHCREIPGKRSASINTVSGLIPLFFYFLKEDCYNMD